jgi:hypothetical protein
MRICAGLLYIWFVYMCNFVLECQLSEKEDCEDHRLLSLLWVGGGGVCVCVCVSYHHHSAIRAAMFYIWLYPILTFNVTLISIYWFDDCIIVLFSFLFASRV